MVIHPRKAAQALWEMGANVTAIADGKKPMHLWDTWQEKRQTEDILNGIPWNGKKSYNGSEPKPAAETVGIISGVNGWRCLDIDAAEDDTGTKHPVPEGVVRVVLAALDLPEGYPWYGRSRSGNGWHVWFRCETDLPTELAQAGKAKETGVKVGTPTDTYSGQFDHIELRWERCQTVLPVPTGYNGHLPNDPPALVHIDQVVAAFLAIATPKRTDKKPTENRTNDTKQHAKSDTHGDVIGAFNERYRVEDILSRNGYEQRGDKWQHPNASDKAAYGVNILENGAYTHHATDPLQNGHCHDAFSAYTTLEHDGDTKAAVKAAAADLGMHRRNGSAPEQARGDQAASGAAAPEGSPPDLASYRNTDEGNAEAFVSLYGNDFRFCNTRGIWLRWNGYYWEQDDRKGAERGAIDTARRRYHAAATIEDLNARKHAAAWAISSESQAKAAATLRAAEKHLITLIDDYDRAPMACAAQSATIDLATGAAQAPARDDLLSMALGTHYDPGATCPKWERFVHEVFSNDADLVRYVQRAVGYSLTGLTSEQKLFLCYGNGANGKSVFLDTIAALLGDYGAAAAFDTFDASKRSEATNDLAMLKGKRFVTITESEQDKRLAEARVKQTTGGDSITCRFLHREFFSYKPAFKIWLAMNHLPTIRGTDRGIWRRIQVVPFLENFEGRENRKLAAELLEELPGILNWALAGLHEWQAQGLGTCAAVERATGEYKADQDKIGRWLTDCTVQAPRAMVTVKAAWESYKAWCEDNNVFAGTKRAWASELKQRGFEPERFQQEWTHIGLGLLSDAPEPDPEPDPAPTPVTQVTYVTQNPGFHARKNFTKENPEKTSLTSLTSPGTDDDPPDIPEQFDTEPSASGAAAPPEPAHDAALVAACGPMADDTRRKIANVRQNWRGSEAAFSQLCRVLGWDVADAIRAWVEAEKLTRTQARE